LRGVLQSAHRKHWRSQWHPILSKAENRLWVFIAAELRNGLWRRYQNNS
jgi:hypothetical protein